MANAATGPTRSTLNRLFSNFGNRCAFPGCLQPIIEGRIIVGEVCHIKAARSGGPRFDPHQSGEERHSYDNLILLCPTHHKVVDADEAAYTVNRLLEMKANHELRVKSAPANEVLQPSFNMIDQLVSSSNQSGGVTAGTVNITVNSEPSSIDDYYFNDPQTFSGWLDRNVWFRHMPLYQHKMILAAMIGGATLSTSLFAFISSAESSPFREIISPITQIGLIPLGVIWLLCGFQYLRVRRKRALG